MKYVIFGAGYLGGWALNYLGYARVLCYADNYAYGKEKEGKKVISFEDLKKLDLENIIVVIANANHWQEIEQQLLLVDNIKYFVFHENDLQREIEVLPIYSLNKRSEVVSYNRILSCYNLSRYSKIAVLGVNRYIPYLLSEIAIQNNYKNIVEIISEVGTDIGQCMGIPVVTWDEADKNFDCLIINEKRNAIRNLENYESADEYFDIIDIYDADVVEPSFYHPELKKYKDMYKGKRIFVIGNGPSLTIEDLNTLHQHQEICIVSNNFYRVYDQTDFRADFHMMCDQDMIEENGDKMKNIPGNVLIGDGYHVERPSCAIKGIQYFHDILTLSGFLPNNPKFSEDLSRGLYRGGTITYDSLQLAAYLGAKEIYLLGIDHNFSNNVAAEGDHFIKNYYSKEEKKRLEERYKRPPIETENSNKAYEAAEKYSRKHGFRIYNATRGGKLEIFERVDFDSLFEKSADSSNE